MQKEIPILFNSAMVQAILSGRKAQTRRIVDPQPNVSKYASICKAVGQDVFVIDESNDRLNPPASPGDLLYVRETWAAEQASVVMSNGPTPPSIVFKAYKASYLGKEAPFGKWRPSIHMPKSLARIWLEVESVRVERLQEISDVDALREGIASGVAGVDIDINGEWWPKGPWRQFRNLWQSVYGTESWNASPWVWVVSFRVISTTGKPCAS